MAQSIRRLRSQPRFDGLCRVYRSIAFRLALKKVSAPPVIRLVLKDPEAPEQIDEQATGQQIRQRELDIVADHDPALHEERPDKFAVAGRRTRYLDVQQRLCASESVSRQIYQLRYFFSMMDEDMILPRVLDTSYSKSTPWQMLEDLSVVSLLHRHAETWEERVDMVGVQSLILQSLWGCTALSSMFDHVFELYVKHDAVEGAGGLDESYQWPIWTRCLIAFAEVEKRFERSMYVLEQLSVRKPI